MEDGKAKLKQGAILKDGPWVHVKSTIGFDCGLWHQITFNLVVPNLPPEQKFVPRHCHNCWKVCVKLKTLQQLFNLHEMQKKLNRPSKCGIEVRESVPGLYGGYFYNKSFQAGLKCYDKVKAAMLKNEFLAPLVDEVDEHGRTTRVILKRGCTEFEHLIGDSNKWVVTPEQEFIEDMNLMFGKLGAIVDSGNRLIYDHGKKKAYHAHIQIRADIYSYWYLFLNNKFLVS